MGTAQMWRDYDWGIEQHFDEYMKEELKKNEFKGLIEPVEIMTEAARRVYQRIWDGLCIYWQQKEEWIDAHSGPEYTQEEWDEATKRIDARGTPRRCGCGCEEEAEISRMREEAGDLVTKQIPKSTLVNPQHDE